MNVRATGRTSMREPHLSKSDRVPPGRLGFGALALAGSIVAMGLFSCGENPPTKAQPPAQPSSDGTPDPAAKNTYVVRGRVVDMPRPESPASDFTLMHEAIPDFVRSDGTLGMNAMRMPFSSETPIDLSGVKMGDKVELRWTVWWDGSFPHSTIDEIRVLDPATELDLPQGG